MRQPIGNDRVGNGVRHELTSRQNLLHLLAELSLTLDVGSEDVARGDGGDGVGGGDPGGLGALTRAGRAEEDESHQRRNPS